MCKRNDYDRLFLAVNSKGDQVRREMLIEQKQTKQGAKRLVDRQSLMRRQRTVSLGGMGGRKGALNRVEFYACLISIACYRYVVSGEISDVSEALQRLIVVDLLSRAARILGTVEDVNDFRNRFCYLEPVDAVLRRHEDSLRALFAALTGRGPGKDSTLLSLNEWMQFLRALDLIHIDLSDRDATFAFAWSRMVVADVGTERGRLAESNLHFEDFLEALCRLSILKALPYDHEIEESMRSRSDVRHAGHFLAVLKLKDEMAYERMLHDRATPWGADPTQPIASCVQHLLAIIIFTVESETAGNDNLKLTETEVGLWCDQKNIDE
jgi:hypothetical protein